MSLDQVFVLFAKEICRIRIVRVNVAWAGDADEARVGREQQFVARGTPPGGRLQSVPVHGAVGDSDAGVAPDILILAVHVHLANKRHRTINWEMEKVRNETEK